MIKNNNLIIKIKQKIGILFKNIWNTNKKLTKSKYSKWDILHVIKI